MSGAPETPETVCVVGLGYVGLPLACLAARRGFTVKGFDVNETVVNAVNAGKSPIRDEALAASLSDSNGKIIAASDDSILANADIVVVCVPTPVDEKMHPDLSAVEKAVSSVAKHLRKGALVCIESTVYPGVTEEVIAPLLEKSGLQAGNDFFLVHCPERIDPGNKIFSLEKIPRVLGGVNAASAEKAAAFYEELLDAPVTVLSSLKAAEAVKIMENTFRDVNIAFINEIAMSFDKLGIDVSEVIRGATTKPFGFLPFYPGPGVGGHCIGVDPYYLIERARAKGFEHKFVSLARAVNNAMPSYVVKRLEQAMAEASLLLENEVVCLLGLAYKANVDDTRESPALKILAALKGKAKSVAVFDPFVPKQSTADSLEDALEGCSAVVLATNHSTFVAELSPERLKGAGINVVVDARNCLDKQEMIAAGLVYKGVGR